MTPQLYCAQQLTEDDLRRVHAAGVRSIINVGVEEGSDSDTGENHALCTVAKELGLACFSAPIDDANLTTEAVDAVSWKARAGWTRRRVCCVL